MDSTEKLCILPLRQLCSNLQAGDTLAQMSNHQFRNLWNSLLADLQIDNLALRPYSLRRGGATSAYQQGATLDVLVSKGRWQSISTCRIYLDAGLQALTQLAVPPGAQPKLAAARKKFHSVSQQGIA